MNFEILLEELHLIFSVYTGYFGFGTKYLQTVCHDINLFLFDKFRNEGIGRALRPRVLVS